LLASPLLLYLISKASTLYLPLEYPESCCSFCLGVYQALISLIVGVPRTPISSTMVKLLFGGSNPTIFNVVFHTIERHYA